MKKVLIGLCLFLGLITSIFSQEQTDTVVLTVEDAVILAADNNLSLKEQKLSLDLLKKKKDSSWNSASPSLSLSGSLGGQTSGTVDAWKDGKQQDSQTLSGSASISIGLTPSLYTSIKDAKLAYESGEETYENTVRSIELNVRKSFYSLLASRENLEVQEKALDSVKQTYEANKIKYSQGRISELELLNSQYNYESKIPSIDNLKNSYSISMDTFKQVLGLPLSQNIQLAGNLEDAVVTKIDDSVLHTDIESIPAIKTAEKNIESAKNSLLATRFSAWGPTVTASGSANFSDSLKNDVKNLSMSYSLGVRIPLDGYLPWSTGALSIESQKTNLEKLNLELENTKTTTIINLRSSYNSIVQAQSVLETYEKNVNLMQKTYEMTRDSYNAGHSDLLTLQTASNNLASAIQTLQNQRLSIISAILDLENTLGLPFGTIGQQE